MTAFFVVGTDTGVGKTTVGAGLLAAAVERGLVAACLKPAESGCDQSAGELAAADARLLARAARYRAAPELICPYRFAAAVAPGVAADREGRAIEFARIGEALTAARSLEPGLLLVEGAGGLLVPLGGGRLLADLVGFLGLPMLVVARAGLGTINHTLLTLESASGRGLRVAGVVLCELEREDPELVASNAREIEQASGVDVLGVFPNLPDATSVAELARAAEKSGLLDALLGWPGKDCGAGC